jgi:hypothetical protein
MAGIWIAHRAAGRKVVGSQTPVDKSRGGKISFIVKALHESIIIFTSLRETCKVAANVWNKLQKSLKLETHISLTSFKHQLSEQLTDHSTCT